MQKVWHTNFCIKLYESLRLNDSLPAFLLINNSISTIEYDQSDVSIFNIIYIVGIAQSNLFWQIQMMTDQWQRLWKQNKRIIQLYVKAQSYHFCVKSVYLFCCVHVYTLDQLKSAFKLFCIYTFFVCNILLLHDNFKNVMFLLIFCSCHI